MKKWQIIAAFTVLILAVAAWRIASYEHERNAPGVATNQPVVPKLTDDQTVVPKKMFIDSLKSAKVLNGKSVWMKTGYTVNYYPYKTGRIDFTHANDRLAPAQELQMKDFVETTTPKDWVTSIPRGPKNAFVVFTEPGRTGEFAAPVGTLDGANSSWACDDIFFYEDPKTLYHWPADVWDAVQKHTPKQGMSEMQTTMAVGNLQQSKSQDYGNRMVSYTTLDGGQTHHFDVTFAGDKATSVSSQ